LKSRFANWFIILCLTVAASGLLYLPMIHGLLSYYRHPYLPTMDYRQFLDWLPRYAMAGIRLPHNLDPLAPPVTGAIFWVLPVLAIVFGSVMGWSRIALRPILLTLGVATVLGALLPLMDPGATEVRFVPWIMPWFCVSITVGLLSAGTQWGRAAAVLGFATLIGSQIQLNINMPPNQPIREGIALAYKIVPPNRDILVLYLGARESVALYGSAAPHHPLLPGPDVQSMLAMEQKSLCDTGHLPWVVIFFEAIARDRNDDGSETRGMWTHLLARYHLAAPRLDGRLTPLAIYAPKEAQKE